MLAAGKLTPSVYIVEDIGITKELDLPRPLCGRSGLFATGDMGAALKLTKVDASSTH